mgnify:CR=1 FL=1
MKSFIVFVTVIAMSLLTVSCSKSEDEDAKATAVETGTESDAVDTPEEVTGTQLPVDATSINKD